MASRKTYTDVQKAEILKKAAETNISTAMKEYGVSRGAIMAWKAQVNVEKAEKAVKADTKKVEKAVKSTGRKAKAAAEKVEAEMKANDQKVENAAKTTKARVKKTRAKKTTAAIIIQSPFGHEIKTEEILARVGDVDSVYVRVDQNKLYWVKGEETGDVDLW